MFVLADALAVEDQKSFQAHHCDEKTSCKNEKKEAGKIAACLENDLSFIVNNSGGVVPNRYENSKRQN